MIAEKRGVSSMGGGAVGMLAGEAGLGLGVIVEEC